MNKILTALQSNLNTPAFAALLLVCAACAITGTQPDQTADKETNQGLVPRSELATTMRTMQNSMQLVSDSLKAGHTVKANFAALFNSIQTAEATTPAKIDDTYHGMASLFISSYERFQSDPENQSETFNAMIETCLVCHREKCTGPIKIISKLKV